MVILISRNFWWKKCLEIFNNYLGIIRFIRAILQYVENKLKAYNNDLTRCLFCVCKCCLWCLEKFMRFINRNAYIMCAIKSTNFCVSAKDAFSLLMRNIVRVLVLNNVSMYVPIQDSRTLGFWDWSSPQRIGQKSRDRDISRTIRDILKNSIRL